MYVVYVPGRGSLLTLVEFTAVAMLIYDREYMLRGDYMACMRVRHSTARASCVYMKRWGV